MKIVDFIQGSQSAEWLEWRKGGIGASEISVLMGSNPYKTPLDLWNQKCGFSPEEPLTPAMAHGIENEPVARDWINTNFQLNLKPICIESIGLPYVRASLDGYDTGKNTICEIKCPVSKKVIEEARTNQRIPDHWFHQMQWQIMIVRPRRAIFAIYDYENDNCITVEMFAEPNMQHVMREKAKEFWHLVRIGKQPELTDKDFIILKDADLHDLLKEYKDMVERENMLSVSKKELKEKIVDFGDDGNFKAFGYRVKRVAARRVYDIEKMRIDGIEVDEYLRNSKGSGGYRITLPQKS